MKVKITCSNGKFNYSKVVDGREILVIGRGDNDNDTRINVRIPSELSSISRWHCMLDIDSAGVWVSDMGSKNGTFVGGKLIGKRPETMDYREARKLTQKRELVTKDTEVDLGTSLRFKVQFMQDIVTPPRAKADIIGGLQDYRKIQLLGKGGMGVVHLVEHTKTHKRYALKEMLPQFTVSEKAKKDFMREARNAEQLIHPNVVKTYGSFFAGDKFGILMEYCPNGTLEKVCAVGKKWPVAGRSKAEWIKPVKIAIELLKTLEYVHTAPVLVRLADGTVQKKYGIVHRDLKPCNVFCGSTGNDWKIADFGLAKAFEAAGLSGSTNSFASGGTLAYMCRQQLIDYKYAKPEVDVWAVVAMLYQMYTGTYAKPFNDHDLPYMVILTKRAVPIKTLVPGLDNQLAKIIDEALDDTKDRLKYQTAASLRRELEKLL